MKVSPQMVRAAAPRARWEPCRDPQDRPKALERAGRAAPHRWVEDRVTKAPRAALARWAAWFSMQAWPPTGTSASTETSQRTAPSSRCLPRRVKSSPG